MKINKKAVIVALIIVSITILILIKEVMNVRGSLIIYPDSRTDISEDHEPLNNSVRIYGMLCDKKGMLWEQRREQIDVIEAVSINGSFVKCSPEKKDQLVGDGQYLMSDDGFYYINGVAHPRKEINNKWYAAQDEVNKSRSNKHGGGIPVIDGATLSSKEVRE